MSYQSQLGLPNTTQSKTILYTLTSFLYKLLKINNLNKNNRKNIITTFKSKDLEFILHYITLTDYYILKKAFK